MGICSLFKKIDLRITALILAGVWVYFIFQKAWVNEDAFITFRVIDNFINGYGLRWNIVERVQAYTHPLWMLINIPVYIALWPNAFYAAIASGLVCSFAAAYLLLSRCSNVFVQAAVFAALYYARFLVEYSTSGLENSLSHLLIILAAVVIIQHERLSHPTFWLTLVFAFALMNRLDLVFLFFPIIAIAFLSKSFSFNLRQIMCGLSPLILWVLFATFYYGSPLPNTYYAKLGGSLQSDYSRQGLDCLFAYLRTDFIGALSLVFSLTVLLYNGLRLGMMKTINWPVMSFALGALLHIAYVVHVGGDYMLGRFFTPATVAAMVCFMLMMRNFPMREKCYLFLLMLCVAGASYHYVHPAAACWFDRSRCSMLPRRIMDVWRVAYYTDGLFNPRGELRTRPQNRWADDGVRLARQPALAPLVIVSIGQVGYYAGPQTPIIDILGLTDAFLARIPRYSEMRLIGHRAKQIPSGYPQAFMGDFSKLDPKMVRLVQFSQSITRGELWSKERLYNIYLLNTGWLDGELAAYYRR